MLKVSNKYNQKELTARAVSSFHYLLVNLLYPAEGVLDLSLLEACDEVVQFEGFRPALAVTIEIDGLFVRLKERLVHELVYRCDHHCGAALSDLIECAEFVGMYRSSLNVHSKMRSHCLEGHVGD